MWNPRIYDDFCHLITRGALRADLGGSHGGKNQVAKTVFLIKTITLTKFMLTGHFNMPKPADYIIK
jgi:hypothetical protein